MRESYPDHVFLYTDGSSCSDAVACAFYCIRASKSFRLHSKCSIFTAEMYAIFEALKYIESATLRRVVICSDSLSSLQAVSRPSSDYLTLSVQSLIHRLLSRRYDLYLVGSQATWVSEGTNWPTRRRNQRLVKLVSTSLLCHCPMFRLSWNDPCLERGKQSGTIALSN